MVLYITVQRARTSHVMQQYITAVAVLQCRNTMITRRQVRQVYMTVQLLQRSPVELARPALTNDDPTID
jgi:hypothetical protein